MSTTGDHTDSAKPTIVLVPLRGVTADSAYIASVVSQIEIAGSHVIMVSQPAAVTDVMVKTAQAVAGSGR